MLYKEFLASGGEKKWQDKWLADKIDRAEDFSDKPKKYVLDFFPYPSAAGLHVGHPEGETATDIYSRYWRMKGYNVLHPMGWDAFGLPAENYAIKTGTHPRKTTEANIATFKRQIQSLGYSYDWDREISTIDPKYYKWTQWIFLQLFKRGLAYEATVPINFCPSCKTGLANEEVKDGKCDRCGSEVERRDMRQWMLRITAYADRLLSGLESLDWPESIKSLQKNWIGRSEGADVDFKIKCRDVARNVSADAIKVYTTRPDTLFGATYMVLSPEHQLVQELKDQIANWQEVQSYIEIAKNKSDLERTELNKEKTGVELKGIKAINPVNNVEIPVWISDYVLASYGTGAIMAVPAHDTRDWEFAKKFEIPIIQVIAPLFEATLDKDKTKPDKEIVRRKNVYVIVKHWEDDSYFCLDWQEHDWKSFVMGGVEDGEDPKDSAIREMKEETGYQNIRSIRKIGGEIHNSFYAEHKGVNRYAESVCYFIELGDGERSNEDEIDAEHHRGEWVSDEKISTFINLRSHKWFWDIYKNGESAFTDIDQGKMINSEFLNGLVPAEAIGQMTSWLTEKGCGKKAINYKLRDWVFSRQRYWGEPIPLVHCQSCKENVLKNSARINFHEQETWGRLVAGQKTVETRALNPEETDRYFGDIKVGHTIKAVNKLTGEEKYFEVLNVWEFKNLAELYKEVGTLAKVYAPKPIPLSLKKMEEEYCYTPDYLERINKNGLIAWEVRMIAPGIIPLEEKDLPLVLPEVEKYEPTGTGESPLATINEWVNTTCPKCDGPVKRETNTMPQWAGSSWYWLRFIDPDNDRELADQKKLKYWLPVDLYLGGAEHAVLHLLYARFWNMVLYDIGVVPQAEPFAKLVNQGLILGEDGEKMSKSRGNVVNPDEILSVHGADSFRMYEMFMGPLEAMKPWSTQGMIGIDRFLEKVWRDVLDFQSNYEKGIEVKTYKDEVHDIERQLNKTIKKVGDDIEKMSFNTAISAMMILMNNFPALTISKDDLDKFLIILAPFAPHLAEELWAKLGNNESIFKQSWPQYDENKIKDETIELPVQINGKVRAKLMLPAEVSEEDAVAAARADANVAKYLEGQTVKKVIFIKGKMLSFVV